MKMYKILIISLILFLGSLPSFAADLTDIKVSPQSLNIGTFYNGAKLEVTGSVPEDSNVVVSLTGVPVDLHMKEKGKVMGLLWMNVNPVEFKGVPSVFIVSSKNGLESLTGFSAPGKGSDVEKLSFSGLKDKIGFEAAKTDKDFAINELIKLKQREGLYSEVAGNVDFTAPSNGLKSFTAKIPVPSRLAPGKYTITVSALKNGEIVSTGTKDIDAKLVGFPSLMAKLAFGHAALYGVLASVIAIFAGLGIGMIFQSKGGAH